MKKLVALSLVLMCLTVSLFVFVPKVQAQQTQILNLKVPSYSWYVGEDSGYFVVIGEVQNNMTEIIGDPLPAATVYTEDGQPLASPDLGFVYAPQLLPNETAPFYMMFSGSQSPTGDLSWVYNVSRVDIKFSGTVKDTDDSVGLVVGAATSYLNASGSYTVAGAILNNGNTYPENVMVVGTFYDANGTVVGVGLTSSYIAHFLAPGTTAPFQFSVYDPAPNVISKIALFKTYVLYFGSALTIPPSPTPSVSSSPSESPSSSISSEPTSSESTGANTLSNIVIYVLIGVIVILVILVILAIFLRRGTKTTNQSVQTIS
jgi:hypothetical protein